MPCSLIVNGYPKHDMPPTHIQGPAVQGMFLHLMTQVDSVVGARLHDDSRYRPYTLSPLGIGEHGKTFRGFQLPREKLLPAGTPCYIRVTLLDDNLFPTFARYFLSRVEPTFQLGATEFTVTTVIANPESENVWTQAISYPELLERARQKQLQRRIILRFVTPTSFSKGDIDLPLPLPRLIFQSYLKRFQEFHAFAFLPDLVELVDLHTGIAMIKHFRTDTIKTKNVILTGFTGEVSFELSKNAPPELVFQMNLLADFAFFCGTGKKTTVGMGQTVNIMSSKITRQELRDFS
jgi:CRISPR-associated endoribonuclease Cas6